MTKYYNLLEEYGLDNDMDLKEHLGLYDFIDYNLCKVPKTFDENEESFHPDQDIKQANIQYHTYTVEYNFFREELKKMRYSYTKTFVRDMMTSPVWSVLACATFILGLNTSNTPYRIHKSMPQRGKASSIKKTTFGYLYCRQLW